MPAETTIYTIRHAHTDYNAEKRYAGSIDIPLNEKGIQDASEAAHQLRPYHFDVVVTSTMQRAIATARLLVDYPTQFVQTPLCNERHFGVMEGHTWDEIQSFDPPILLIEVGNDQHTVNPRGGEPFEDVWERAKKFRNYLFQNYRGKRILVVSHGVFLQMFHGLLRGITCIESLADYPPNLELFKFQYMGNRLVDQSRTRLNRAPEKVSF